MGDAAQKLERPPFAWSGATIVCCASGPSLTLEDVEAARDKWGADHLIVTNTTFRLAPFAGAMICHDMAYLKTYLEEIRSTFKGQVWTCAAANFAGVRSTHRLPNFRTFGNSGCAAISLAAYCRAKRAILLGFDVQHTGGKTHWHGAHPSNLGDARSVAKWHVRFAQCSDYVKRRGLVVVNATRETALKCFPRADLESLLCES